MAAARRSDEETFRTGPRIEGPLRLLAIQGDGVRSHALSPQAKSGRVRIGRASDNDMSIQDASMSRHHAIIEVDEGGAIGVWDLGSVNGTRVRGRLLDANERVEILAGDVVELGSVVLVVQCCAATADEDSRAAAPTEQSPSKKAAPSRPKRIGAGDLLDVVVADPATVRLFELVERVARSEISVLLLGETGAGKEIVASAIHERSPRARAPFVRLHVAALSPTLIEAELFGHERGAFTGAATAKPGLFEMAEGGTVLLDEIGELTPALQVKLLRVLEERMVMRVGGLSPRPLDVRFIAATNRDLRGLVATGAFREDLFFRLNGISLLIPPLRQRPGDIEPLARSFLARARRTSDVARMPRSGAGANEDVMPPAISPAALSRLRAYEWPGNVRELRNAIEHAAVLCEGGVIGPTHLPPEIALGPPQAGVAYPVDSPPQAGVAYPVDGDVANPAYSAPASAPLRDEVEALERRRIVEALQACGGSQTRAAQLLGMPRRTLTDKLRAYGIPRPRSR